MTTTGLGIIERRQVDEEPMTLGAYLRAAREAADLNQWDVAHEIGVDQGYVSKIERGVVRRPNDELVVAFARAVEASPETALRLAGYPVRTASGEEAIAIPVRGVVPADRLRFSSGEGASVDEVRVLPDEVASARSPISELFALQVSGDCLRSLGIWHGDIVIVEPVAGRAPRDNQLVVVRVNDEVSLKRWRSAGARVELQDGDGRTVYRLLGSDDFEVLAFFVTWKPIAPRQ